MKRGNKAIAGFFAVGLTVLTGCQTQEIVRLDPLGTTGRDGGQSVSYEAMLRIAAAARAGGDFANAVSVYRHAATINLTDPTPVDGLADTLLEMGEINEAIVTYNKALAMNGHDRGALTGLARAYLQTGRPELAENPLAIAFADKPDDPKLLMLIGVADDFVGQHAEAQKRYRAGLLLAPTDTGLILDLALSLALSERFDEAIALLRPVAVAPSATPLDRQTMALIFGLRGDPAMARRFAQVDLDPSAVTHNLAFYETLRHLSPDARSRAILSASAAPRRTP